MKTFLIKVLPWIITVVALYLAFRDIDWSVLITHLKSANRWWLGAACVLTFSSYLLRGRRWQHLFPQPIINFTDAARVLILGFFMNNILPARTGELVRAHMGSRVTKETRTHVLGTIASERLADGLMISLLFSLASFRVGHEKDLSGLHYVAVFFGAAALAVVTVIIFRERIFSWITRITERLNHKVSDYTGKRIRVFIDALTPLCSLRRLPSIILWSTLIWLVEVFVFCAVTRAFNANLSYPLAIMFMVVVNFASLIPAAPGGVGVIEAVATAVLVSLGVQKELALPMVIAQHVIQMLVVGVMGAGIMATWKSSFKQVEAAVSES